MAAGLSSAAPAALKRRASPDDDAFAVSPARILLVDDDPLTLRVLERTLTTEGYEVRLQDGGFGLAVAIRHFRPHLVLLDVRMPGLSGDAAMKAAAELPARWEISAPVVLHSGVAVEELQQLATEIGAIDVLSKPASPRQVLGCVSRALAASGPQAAAR